MAIPLLEGIVVALVDEKVEVDVRGDRAGIPALSVQTTKPRRRGGSRNGLTACSGKGVPDVFRNVGCQTKWDGPCLVVIGYTAAKATIASSY
ncbi:hypothetical protein [Rhodobacteraceae bacterium DSL-40]|uniref:hypothetical protein n=1 Tax=Amaricoccus sp. B4 TaxID=3368557 RepID=UPI0013A6AAA9